MRRSTRRAAENRLECLIQVISAYQSSRFSDLDGLIRWYENHVETKKLTEARQVEGVYKKDSILLAVFYVKSVVVRLKQEGLSLEEVVRFLWSTSLLIEGELSDAS